MNSIYFQNEYVIIEYVILDKYVCDIFCIQNKILLMNIVFLVNMWLILNFIQNEYAIIEYIILQKYVVN